jgi:hypothetical protein
MKNLIISTFALSLIVMLFLVGTIFVTAVGTTTTTTPPAQPEADWYVQIADGNILVEADHEGVEIGSILVPREIRVVSTEKARSESSKFKLIAEKNNNYGDITAYITEKRKGFNEITDVKVTGIAVSKKVFDEILEFNKQQTEVWDPYGQIHNESKLLDTEYARIRENLKDRRLNFNADLLTSSIILKIDLAGDGYTLGFTKMNVETSENPVNFDNSFLIEGISGSTIDLKETSDEKGKGKEILITRTGPSYSDKFIFSLKDISVVQGDKTEKANIPFKSLKTAKFEIKNNILYSAILNAENIPSTTDVYYYLPQGIVVFPDSNEKIDVQFFREGTKNPLLNNGQDEIKVLKEGEFKVKANNAKISVTCSCQCKTLFTSPVTIKTTATRILEMYMGKDAKFFYVSPLFDEAGQPDDTLVNEIVALNEKGSAFSSYVSNEPAKTAIVFDKTGTFRFVGLGSTSSIAGKTIRSSSWPYEPYFSFNGWEIDIKETFGPQGNKPTQRNKIDLIPTKNENGKIVSKMEADLSLGKAEKNALSNNQEAWKITFSQIKAYVQDVVYEEIIPIKTPTSDISLIKTAKEFETTLKQKPTDIKEPDPVKPEIKGEEEKEKCDISYGKGGYYCKQFSIAITDPLVKGYEGYDWTCITTPKCEGKYCCSGDNSIRCCKQGSKSTTKPKGDRSWKIDYREIGGSNSQQSRGRLGLDIQYNVPLSYGFDSGPRAFRYDYGEITHVTNVLNAYDPLNEFVKKDSYAKTDVAEFKNWFEKIAKPIFKCKIYLYSTKWPDKTKLESISLTYKPGSLPDTQVLAKDAGFAGGYAEVVKQCVQVPSIKSIYGDPVMGGASNADEISKYEWELVCRPELPSKNQKLGLNIILKQSDGSLIFNQYRSIFYGYYLYSTNQVTQDIHGIAENGQWAQYPIDLHFDRLSPDSIANYWPEFQSWFSQQNIRNEVRELIKKNCEGQSTAKKLPIFLAPGIMPQMNTVTSTASRSKKTYPSPPIVGGLPDILSGNWINSYFGFSGTK